MILSLLLSSLAFSQITPLSKEDKLSIKNISCATKWYHYLEDQEKVPMVTKTYDGEIHHTRYLWNSKLYLDPPNKLHDGLEIFLSPGLKDQTSFDYWHSSIGISFKKNSIFYFRDTSLYFYGVWEPNRVHKYDWGPENETGPKDLYRKGYDSNLCIIDQKRIGPDLFVRLPFNFNGKPIWRRLIDIDKNKMEFLNLLGDAFIFHNMPPFIESADGKKVFLVDHSLKSKFKGKEVKLLEKARDSEYWEEHYVTRIENGYVYFNTFIRLGWFSRLNEKIHSFMDEIPNAERRVSIDYFIRDNGSVSAYVFKASFSEPSATYIRSKKFVKEGVSYQELTNRFLKDEKLNIHKEKTINEDWKKYIRAVIN